jgi:hypothetical protein
MVRFRYVAVAAAWVAFCGTSANAAVLSYDEATSGDLLGTVFNLDTAGVNTVSGTTGISFDSTDADYFQLDPQAGVTITDISLEVTGAEVRDGFASGNVLFFLYNEGLALYKTASFLADTTILNSGTGISLDGPMTELLTMGPAGFGYPSANEGSAYWDYTWTITTTGGASPDSGPDSSTPPEVPLPAGLPLILSAVVLLGSVRLRRRKH